jgi:hypothetical protein
VVQALYSRRADAFARADPSLLDEVYADGSPLLPADYAAVRALAEAGERVDGFLPRVEAVTGVDAAGDRVRLQLRDGWDDYTVVSAAEPDGPPLRAGPRRETGAAVLDLVPVPGGWRIAAASRGG